MTKQQQYIEPVGFKGTPGHWSASLKEDYIDYDSNRIDIHAMGYDIWVASATFAQSPLNEAKHNAALIANAKEVLKVLQAMVEDIEACQRSGIIPSATLRATAREVIAKSIQLTK